MSTQQGIFFHLSLPRVAAQRLWPSQSGRWAGSALKLEPVQPLSLPSDWIEVRPCMSGICGSDIALLHGESSPYLSPLTSFPAVLGHEIVAELPDSHERVVVNPSLSCQARRLPLCPMCETGRSDDCVNRVNAPLGPGLLLGYNAKMPGGWSQCMWAPQEQLIPVPPEMSDQRAVLTEPAAIVLAGLQRIDWSAVGNVLVIGTGTLGLLSLALIAELHPSTRIFALARYPVQQQMAGRMGSIHVVADADRDEAFRAIVGTPWKTLFGYPPHYSQGFDLVVVTAGSQSALTGAIGWTGPAGQLLLLGGTATARLDWTPVWARQIRVQGSYGYGKSAEETFTTVLSLFSRMEQPLESLVTHEFALSEHPAAIKAVMHKKGVIKAVFTPNRQSTATHRAGQGDEHE